MPSITKTERRKKQSLENCKECGEAIFAAPSKGQRYCSTDCARKNPRFRHGENCTPLHESWKAMRSRGSSNPNYPSYKRYGARGITVCPEWHKSYVVFRDWALANGYKEGLQLDRIDGNKGYSPGNCRWVTQSQNMQNTRHHRDAVSKYKGVSKTSSGKLWRTRILLEGKEVFGGNYTTQLAAALAYDDLAAKHFGQFAMLNFPERYRIRK